MEVGCILSHNALNKSDSTWNSPSVSLSLNNWNISWSSVWLTISSYKSSTVKVLSIDFNVLSKTSKLRRPNKSNLQICYSLYINQRG